MKIAIIGYGKMGHMIEDIALQRGHEIVGIIDPTICASECSLPILDFDSDTFRSAQVAIEFSTPATAESNVRASWAKGVPVVCGSTGWNVMQPTPAPDMTGKEENGKWVVRDSNGKIMLVWSSNYSIGVNMFFALNEFVAQQMVGQPQYTPFITETHHIHKLDKPSGTAKTLAEEIEAKGLYKVSIESIREGEVPGTHIVEWDSAEDTIIITHIAKGRKGFALGAVVAAEGILDCKF